MRVCACARVWGTCVCVSVRGKRGGREMQRPLSKSISSRAYSGIVLFERIEMARADPMTSWMSDEMIAISIMIQRMYRTSGEYCTRQICARFMPVLTPSRAESLRGDDKVRQGRGR